METIMYHMKYFFIDFTPLFFVFPYVYIALCQSAKETPLTLDIIEIKQTATETLACIVTIEKSNQRIINYLENN